MTRKNDRTRVLMAVTEASPIERLWQAALEMIRETEAELYVLLLIDDRWHRAASLPFTREISRIGGAHSDFTRQRAEQVRSETVAKVRMVIEEKATEANLVCSFETLSESEPEHINEFVVGRRSIVVAPSGIRTLPLFASIERLDCQIVLVET